VGKLKIELSKIDLILPNDCVAYSKRPKYYILIPQEGIDIVTVGGKSDMVIPNIAMPVMAIDSGHERTLLGTLLLLPTILSGKLKVIKMT